MKTTNWRTALALVVMLMAVVVTGCGAPAQPAATAPTSAPTEAPATAATPEATGTGATVAETSPPAAEGTASAPAGSSAEIDAIKAAVQGKSLKMGFSSQPTLLDTVGVKTVQILEKEFGVNVDYRSLEAATMAAAVVSGDLNVGEVSLSRIASLKLGGGDPLIFASNDIKNDYVVVAKQDIPTPADMKGRIWGNSSEAGVTVVIRTAFFEKHGLNYETDVRSVTTGSSSASMQAFAAGQLDVGLLHPDQAATLMEKNPGKFHIIYYTYEAVQLINDVWYGNKAWVEQNPEMTQAISLASIIAARWAYADKDAFLALSKEYVPDFSEQVISDSYDILAGQVKLWEANGGLSQDSCESAMAVSVSAGAVEEAVDCSSLLDTSFQERSLTILGAQ